MFKKYIKGFVWINVLSFFTVFAIMVEGYGKEFIESGKITGIFILFSSPFVWIFVREIESKRQVQGHYPTFSSQITDINKHSLFSLMSLLTFVSLIFLGEHVRQNNKTLSDWLISAGFIIFLLCIISIIYSAIERIRR